MTPAGGASTVEQNNQRQKELLNASGRIDRFFEDKISGRTKTERPGLGECMAYVRDGDELINETTQIR